ncbi:MAG: hypothetical protein JNK89_07715, partial [Saprospiraceae bacterium]|nr:hypothetical protein [Saprospiraceae bacterium]
MELLNIRELLRQGDTGKALAELIAVLQQDVRYRDNLLRTLRVLESEYNAVRQKELKGILPFQEAQREYNATNDALLAILDDVEAGRVPGSSALGGGRRNLILAVFGGAMLVLAAFTLWRAFGKKDAGCPEFSKEQALHVLVLPFDNLGTKAQSVEAIIQRDISNLTQKAKIPVEVILATRQTDDPPSLQIAESRGRTCKADLVIYGMYKAFDPGDSLAVNLGFKY